MGVCVYFNGVRGGGPNYNDYLNQCIGHVISEGLDIHFMESNAVVESEIQAQTMDAWGLAAYKNRKDAEKRLGAEQVEQPK